MLKQIKTFDYNLQVTLLFPSDSKILKRLLCLRESKIRRWIETNRGWDASSRPAQSADRDVQVSTGDAFPEIERTSRVFR